MVIAQSKIAFTVHSEFILVAYYGRLTFSFSSSQAITTGQSALCTISRRHNSKIALPSAVRNPSTHEFVGALSWRLYHGSFNRGQFFALSSKVWGKKLLKYYESQWAKRNFCGPINIITDVVDPCAHNFTFFISNFHALSWNTESEGFTRSDGQW